jgi:hypothetical protein
MDAGNRLLFEARLLISPLLRIDLYYQKKAYHFIKMYHRKKLKEELETTHQHIFSDTGNLVFRQKIYNLFK